MEAGRLPDPRSQPGNRLGIAHAEVERGLVTFERHANDTVDRVTDVVQVGSVVHVKDEKTGKSVKYTIVGSAEANPEESKLSNESPVGRALIGHKRGDLIAVQVPRGPARKLKITKIDVGLE